jgi:hypothetical protein
MARYVWLLIGSVRSKIYTGPSGTPIPIEVTESYHPIPFCEAGRSSRNRPSTPFVSDNTCTHKG